MAGRLTMAEAERRLRELHPNKNVEVGVFGPGGWELRFDLPYGPGKRRAEAVSDRELATTPPDVLLRVMSDLIRRRVRESEELGREPDPWYRSSGPSSMYTTSDLKDMIEFNSRMYAQDLYAQNLYGQISDQPRQRGKSRSERRAEVQAAKELIEPILPPPASMTFEAYVAELHANLDPRGRDL
jgi:hypothetical protein